MRALLGSFLAFSTAVALAAPPLSMDWILSQVGDGGVKTIEQLLAAFPNESLQRHLLVYGSESQQAASFAYPRVIVHSDDADFLMAFNGEPGSAGYQDLEILHFDRASATFTPEVLHFDPQGQHAPQVDRHPQICAQCHQDDVRPNWDPYFHWVGFFGSEDDNYLSSTGSPILYGPEADALRAFRNRQSDEIAHRAGRYRFLPPNPAARPNLCFNNRLVVLNMRRVLRILAAAPQSGRLLPAFDLRYPELAVDRGALPADWVAQASRPYQEVEWDTESGIRSAMQNRINRHTAITGWGPVGRVASQLQLLGNGTPMDANTDFSPELKFNASMRYVFEELLHQPYYPLTTSRHVDYQLNTGASEALRELMQGMQVNSATGRLVFDPSREVPASAFDNCGKRPGALVSPHAAPLEQSLAHRTR